MWVRKDDWVARVAENASLSATIQSNVAELRRLHAEISYWRERFEREQRRADRIADLAFESEGFRPVTDTGVAEAKAAAERMAEMQKRMAERNTEMYADSIGDEDELPVEGLGIDPELMESLAGGIQELRQELKRG